MSSWFTCCLRCIPGFLKMDGTSQGELDPEDSDHRREGQQALLGDQHSAEEDLDKTGTSDADRTSDGEVLMDDPDGIDILREEKQSLLGNQHSSEDDMDKNEELDSDGVSDGEVLVQGPHDNDPRREEEQSVFENQHSTQNDLNKNAAPDGKGTPGSEVLVVSQDNKDHRPEEPRSLTGTQHSTEDNLDKNGAPDGDGVDVNLNFRERLQKNYDKIVNCLRCADDIATKLLERGDIGKLQLESIQLEKNKIRKIELLMDIIQLSDERVFESFLSILLETQQSPLFRLLAGGIDFCLDHVKLIQNNYTYLVENIDPMSGLLDRMFQSGGLAQEELREIKRNETTCKRNKDLLKLLMRKDLEIFSYFLKALHESRQGHVAECLNSNSNAGKEIPNVAPTASESRQLHVINTGETLHDDASQATCNAKLRHMLSKMSQQFSDLPEDIQLWLSVKQTNLDFNNNSYIAWYRRDKHKVFDLRQKNVDFVKIMQGTHNGRVSWVRKGEQILDEKSEADENFKRILVLNLKTIENRALLERISCRSKAELVQLKKELKEELKGELKGELRKELREELREELEDELKKDLKKEPKENLREELLKKLKEELKEELREELKDKLRKELREKLKEEMKEKLKEKLKEELKRKLKEELIKELKEELKDVLKKELQDELEEKLREELKEQLTEMREELKGELKEILKEELTRKLKEQKEELREELKEIMKVELKGEMKKELKKELKEELLVLDGCRRREECDANNNVEIGQQMKTKNNNEDIGQQQMKTKNNNEDIGQQQMKTKNNNEDIGQQQDKQRIYELETELRQVKELDRGHRERKSDEQKTEPVANAIAEKEELCQKNVTTNKILDGNSAALESGDGQFQQEGKHTEKVEIGQDGVRKWKYGNFRLIGKITNRKESKGVDGVAWLDNKIYTVCDGSNRVHVHPDQKPFDELEDDVIEIEEMKEPKDMSASEVSRSIFIGDFASRCIWRIRIPCKETSRWEIDGQPTGLSINSSSDELIVVVELDRVFFLNIYRCEDGEKVKSLSLPGITIVFHVVQSSNGNFIISHMNTDSPKVNLIREMTGDGLTIIRTFDPRSIELNELIRWWPHHLSIDEDDNILVVDSFNNRIIVLNDHQIIVNQDQHQIIGPRRLCYVRGKRMLIVAHSWSSSSVSLFSVSK